MLPVRVSDTPPPGRSKSMTRTNGEDMSTAFRNMIQATLLGSLGGGVFVRKPIESPRRPASCRDRSALLAGTRSIRGGWLRER